ncbi:hypothetical protein [Alkalilimnicola ehrlichii]|uniref:Uncharacterized protein n=1 Tax=Alkalilimnicola ehrlichii TaxID=351052 RepID=A0A3E0X194_9GAMM|nr:hypothetical protein [Alkalilimnicola ehrlichii]RFA39423.1 hypothetical protein CAL65_01075 [Alkalilimnicola ehrlichii]
MTAGSSSVFSGPSDSALFLKLAVAYLVFSVMAYLAVSYRRPRFRWQLYCHVSVDIVAITMLIHASGTLGSGLGALMLVAVAAGSILTNRRMAFFLPRWPAYRYCSNKLIRTFSPAGIITITPRPGCSA